MFIKFTRTRRIAALAAVVTVAGAWLLPGCSAADPADSRAAADAPAGGGSGESAKSEGAFVAWQLQFASCMREQGFDVPDPSGASNESMTIPDDLDAFETAADSCREEIGEPPVTSGRDPQELLERDAAFVSCLRENGVQIDDPQPGEPAKIPDVIAGDLLEKCFAEAGAA